MAIQKKLQEMQQLADDLDLKMYQLALAWVLSHKQITSTITGARLPEQIEMNSTASGITLDQSSINTLEAIFEDRQPTYNYR